VALVALDGGQADLGLAAIAAAERLGALTLESLEIKANLLRVAGKVEAAEQVLRLALQRSDARAATWFHLNVVLMHAGRDAEALEAATTALALWQPAAMDVTFDYGGQHPKLLTNRGICLGRLGRLEEAEAALAEAVALGPHIATAWASLGAVRSMRGNTQGSIEAARRAVDLEPNNAQALNNLSSSLLDLGQAQEAHALLQRAVAAAPRHALAWRNLGIAECQLNRGEAGRAAFQQAFDLNPRNEDVVRRYADLLVNTGRATQALDVIATFRAKGGTASVALAQKEDWARSARDLEVALSDATWDAKTLLARARTEREHKRHWLSACCFARALREQPAWVTTHAVEAARAAIAGARFADLPQREELFALGAQWLRSRLEYLRAQPAGQGREEAANWNSQFPLGAAELLHVPEPTRPPWVQLASDLTLFLQSVGG
jgi:tetratricopeptide (TPR) repeat protein